MIIDGKRLSSIILSYCKEKLKSVDKRKVKLSAVYVGKDPNQLGYLKKKSQIARKLGVSFELTHFEETPSFEKFATTLRNIAYNPKTTGVIIQQPLPPELRTQTIYNFIPLIKEIEGFAKKSPFYPPIGLAILSILKYVHLAQIYENPEEHLKDILISPILKEKYMQKLHPEEQIKTDKYFFKETFGNKKIVLVGRGITGGKPVGETLKEFGIQFINVNSSTPNPENFFKIADIIITAVGEKIIYPEMLKEDVILINIGQRKENGKIKGDYDEEEIKDIAKYYTPVVGGTGPLNIAYLYKNLIESALLQQQGVKF